MLVALAGSTLVAGCGDDDGPATGDGKKVPEFFLEATRADGSVLGFSEHTLTCDPRYYDGETPSGEIIEVRSQPDRTTKEPRPYFFIHAVVSDVEDGASFEFGRDLGFVYDDPRGIDLVIADGRADEPFVISEEESKGTITVRSATCSPKPAIELEISGTLANEYAGAVPGIEVSGRIDVGG